MEHLSVGKGEAQEKLLLKAGNRRERLPWGIMPELSPRKGQSRPKKKKKKGSLGAVRDSTPHHLDSKSWKP